MQPAAPATDTFSDVSDEDIFAANWDAGELSWLLMPHQLAVYLAIRAFEARVLAGENDGPPIYVLDCARRWGKTFLVCLIMVEQCLRRENGRFTYATAIEGDIGEIVIPIIEEICETAPERCKPVYRTTKRGLNAGYYFPNGSVLKLVGVDKKPRGLRGKASDGHAWTEAAFFANLERDVGKTLHQFQKRPWAFMILESSAPEDPEHDFDEVFVPEAKARGAYTFQTIEDNTSLTPEQIRKFYLDACKISVAEADRELYGKRSREFDTVIVPEFDEERHVRDEIELPRHAYCITAADPGYRHLFGATFLTYDFDRATVLVLDSWARRNAGPHHAAAAIAAREYALWGTWPSLKMARIPLESSGEAIGWKDLLLRDKHEKLAPLLHEMANVPREQRPDYENRPGRWVMHDIPDCLTYWDENDSRHKNAPADRVSDVDYQLIQSLGEHYGLDFRGTTKTELRMMVNTVRNYHSDGRILYARDAGPVIDHVRAGKWAKDRYHFQEHRHHGHYDCCAALVYGVRLIDQVYQQRRPHPPPEVERLVTYGQSVQGRLPWVPATDVEQALQRELEAARGHESGRLRAWDE